MIYQKYEKTLRAVGAAAALLMLSACGDSAPGTENVVDLDDLLAADLFVEGKEGVWGDITYGNVDAPITVVEYGSLTCSHCADFSKNTFPKVKENFIDTGKVRFIYRNLVRDGLDMVASTVARCRDMETSKRLMKTFFSRQREWMGAEDRNGALASLARRTANMSRTEFDRCASNRDLMASLTEMAKTGRDKFRVNGTPTVFVNGLTLNGYGFEDIKKAVESAED